MSADYGTEHFKGYAHLDRIPPYIAVVHRADPRDRFPAEHPVGMFSREEITELVELAEQAWPGLAESVIAAVRQVRPSVQWAVAWGSTDLNDGVGYVEVYDDEEDAGDHVGLYPGGSVVRRTVLSLPWEPAGE